MSKNILFIMCDQLRYDYLSCYGHPHLHTPNIDALAARGVRFENAYVQSPICGPSRMSYYTGRYVRSHGSTWNGTPLRIGEPTLGDHLQELGVRNVLLGKTHMRADTKGLARLGIEPDSEIGIFNAQCGFEVYERDDGLHPDNHSGPSPLYNKYLNAQGFDGDNPWQSWANSAEGDDGELLSGWLMENADRPARIPDYYSETPYLTRRAMQFIDEADDTPWCLHLSYIKPHWPYMAPAPYHNLYSKEHVIAPNRCATEQHSAHPLHKAYMQHFVSQTFSRDEVRDKVIPTYMGLIKQIDDQMGILFKHLEQRGIADQTMIVFTSDHGDYLGDHWLGEKELFHEASVKVPLIIYNPERCADSTRGQASKQLIESIDLAPTFIDFMGGDPKYNILEGKSLLPLLAGDNNLFRQYAFSEYDYSMRRASTELKVTVGDARMVMIRDARYKYTYVQDMRPMLFDLLADPQELQDLATDPEYASTCERFSQALCQWALQHHNRITISDQQIDDNRNREVQAGILIGYWEQNELDQALQQGEDL